MVNTEKKSTRSLTLLTILSAAGAIISLIQTQHFFDVRGGIAGFKSFCNVGTTFNCNAVDASPYAEIFGGFPLSGVAAGWFIALTLILLVARMPSWRKEALKMALALSAVGSLVSLIYLFIMIQVIKTGCLLCLAIDAINFTSLAVLLGLVRRENREAAGSKKVATHGQAKTLALTALGAIFVSAIIAKSMEKMELPSSAIEEMYQNAMSAAPVPVSTPEESPSIGPKDARVTIVKFSDFQCPSCRMGAFTLHPVLKRFEGKVRFVYRNFPLDRSCNRIIDSSMHPAACEAARAALCAHQQGKFEEVYGEMFELQKDLAPGRPAEIAKSITGIDAAAFDACMTAPETATKVSNDIEEGIRLNVQSTPTFFVNGKKVMGALPPQVWARVIEENLK